MKASTLPDDPEAKPDSPPAAATGSRRGLGWYLGLPFRAIRLSLFSNAFYLLLNTAVGALLGAVFWLVAARFYPESDVGFAAALIPLTLFIANLGTLGLPAGLVRFLPEAGGDTRRTGQIVNASLTLSALASMLLGLVFVLGIDVWAPSFFFIRIDPRFFIAFVLFCGIVGVVPMIDAVAIARRKAQYALGRNAIYNGIRAPLPIVLAGIFGIFGLFFSFVLGALAGALVGLFLFLPRLIARYRPRPTLRFGSLRHLFRFSLGNHAAGLLAAVAPSMLPLLVVELRSPVENAWFYIAWFLGSMLYVIPGAFTLSLYAEGSQVNADVPRDVSRTVIGSALLLLPAGLFLFFFGDWLLAIFGSTYASGGFELLRWLVVATPFVLTNAVYLTLVRIKKRISPLILASAFVSFFVVTASWLLLPSYGLTGVGIAWLFGQALLSLVVGAAVAAKSLRR